MKRVLVTGANRGLGLELVKQYLQRGDMVFAGVRNLDGISDLEALQGDYPERLNIYRIDVDDPQLIQASVKEIQQLVESLDLLICNAGIFPRDEHPGKLTQQILLSAFRTNAIGPILVVQAYLELLKSGVSPTVVNITSQLGSLTNKRSGGNYSYCASKAALNMLSRTLAYDLQPLGITVIGLHPGWVQTDMGGSGAPLTPQKSVAGMLDLISHLTLNDTGELFAWDGDRLPC